MMKVNITSNCGSELSMITEENKDSYLCSSSNTAATWKKKDWSLSIDYTITTASLKTEQEAEAERTASFAKHTLKYNAGDTSAQWHDEIMKGDIEGIVQHNTIDVEAKTADKLPI